VSQVVLFHKNDPLFNMLLEICLFCNNLKKKSTFVDLRENFPHDIREHFQKDFHNFRITLQIFRQNEKMIFATFSQKYKNDNFRFNPNLHLLDTNANSKSRAEYEFLIFAKPNPRQYSKKSFLKSKATF
jgi:hypothetical protein